MSLKISAFRKIHVHIWYSRSTMQMDPDIGFLCCNSSVQLIYALNANFAPALDKDSARRIYPCTCTCTVNFLLAKQIDALLLVLSAAQITPQRSLTLTSSAQCILKQQSESAEWPQPVRGAQQQRLAAVAEMRSRLRAHVQAGASQTAPSPAMFSGSVEPALGRRLL